MSSKERDYISDDEAWQIFVGIASPEEVLGHYESIDEAIDSILQDPEWDEPVPSWLGDSLRRCFERVYGDELN